MSSCPPWPHCKALITAVGGNELKTGRGDLMTWYDLPIYPSCFNRLYIYILCTHKINLHAFYEVCGSTWRVTGAVNLLTPVRFESHFRYTIFILHLISDGWDIPREIALRLFSLHLICQHWLRKWLGASANKLLPETMVTQVYVVICRH